MQYVLVPGANPQYWIGLEAQSWPTFAWSDTMVPAPNAKGGYTNWGIFYNALDPIQLYRPEPNNLVSPEVCAVGNHTQASGKPFTWAWADANCLNSHVSICRVNRERLHTVPPRLVPCVIACHDRFSIAAHAAGAVRSSCVVLTPCILLAPNHCSSRPEEGIHRRVHRCDLHPQHAQAVLR